ncbi:MAG: hypothetical protein NC411_05155 [Bacteroides sp.]|nr:hypothetical protein [Bacteroides sp.]
MTLIAAWVGVDCKKEGNKISSIYIASDSRFSWNTNCHYDEGIKVFCSLRHPYIFGYCGDVLFPLHILERIIYKIDIDLLFSPNINSFRDELEIIKEEIESSLCSYPPLLQDFSIICASRKSYYDFHLGKIWSKGKTVGCEEIGLPNKSSIVYCDGTGKNDLNTVMTQLSKDKNPNEGTSRFYYHCIAKTIKECSSHTVGGVPQLVGLYRKGNGLIFGIVEDGNRYVLGKHLDYRPDCLQIQWRNSNFEIVNPETLILQEGAQTQPF